MFSQSTNTKIERSYETGVYTKIAECADVDDPRDPEDDEDEQE